MVNFRNMRGAQPAMAALPVLPAAAMETEAPLRAAGEWRGLRWVRWVPAMRRWMTSWDEGFLSSSCRLARKCLGWACLVAIVACRGTSDHPAPDHRACSIWLRGMQADADNTEGPTVLYRTRDGGRTWAPAGRFPYSLDRNEIESLHFSDPDRGWLGTRMALYRSLDGGESWKRHLPLWDVPIEGIGDVFSAVTVNQIQFFDNERGLVFVEGQLNRQSPGPSATYVLRTTDGGATWRGARSDALLGTADDPSRPGSGRVPTACATRSGRALAQVMASVVPGEDFSLSVTDDYGQSWHPLPRLRTIDYSSEGHGSVQTWCTGNDEFWIGSYGSTLLRSRDGGQTWQDLGHRIPKLAEYFRFEVATSRILIVDGRREDGTRTTLRSRDSGRTWQELHNPDEPPYWGLVAGAAAEGSLFIKSDEFHGIFDSHGWYPYDHNLRALIFPLESQGENPWQFPFPPDAWRESNTRGITRFVLMEPVAPGGGCPGA